MHNYARKENNGSGFSSKCGIKQKVVIKYAEHFGKKHLKNSPEGIFVATKTSSIVDQKYI